MEVARAGAAVVDVEAELVELYPALVRRLTMVLRDPVEAEDVAQAAFARAFELLGRFRGGDCISADEASSRLRASLDQHGVKGWTIEVRPGVGNFSCLFAGQVSTVRVVALFPAMGKVAGEAMQAVVDELFNNCYGRGDAIALVSAASRSVGITKFEVSADPWGPKGGPIDKAEAYEAHVAAGCFVWAGSGLTGDGTPVYYLWGPWPWGGTWP